MHVVEAAPITSLHILGSFSGAICATVLRMNLDLPIAVHEATALVASAPLAPSKPLAVQGLELVDAWFGRMVVAWASLVQDRVTGLTTIEGLNCDAAGTLSLTGCTTASHWARGPIRPSFEFAIDGAPRDWAA